MSRKRANPQMSRAAQRTADASAAGRQGVGTVSAAPSSRRGTRGLVAIVVVGALFLVGFFLNGLAGGKGADPSARPSSSATAVNSVPSASGTAAGGPLAEKLVAALQADPFRAHIDETTVARSTAGTVTVTLTAKAVGDVSGRDVSLHVSSTGAGPAVDQDVVSLGSTTWIRRTGATTWEVHRRTEAGASIDALLSTIRLLDDPNDLTDAGPETVDGQSLHRLSAIGSVAYRSSDGTDASFDRLDIWVTDAGLPVLARGSFTSSSGTKALIGNVSIRYSDVGKPPTITPPTGAPTAIP